MNTDEFIKGFRELRRTAPRISVSGYQNLNCPYGNAIYNSKNCYSCFDMDSSEGCLYCGMATRSRFCVDCEDVWDSELCCEGVEIYNCYNCDFSQFLRDCSDCAYCFDCLNCHNCFGCVGLRRAQFHIFNERYTPDEYEKKLSFVKKMPAEEFSARVEALRKNYPHVALRQYRTEQCFGDNIQNSKNCFFCFNAKGIHDGGYLFDQYNVYGELTEDSYDCFFSVDLHQSYECIQVGDGWDLNYCHYCEHLRESQFCEGCFNSRNLFGCAFINRKEYLILNKPVTKEEWHKLTSKIKDDLKLAGNYSWKIF